MDGVTADRRIQAAVRHWGLTPDGPVVRTPSGTVGFWRRRGAPVVLKVPKPGTDEALAHLALEHFGSAGAVAVLDHWDGATLLERALPGDALTDLVLAGRDGEASGILCDVAAALARPEVLPAGFPSIEHWGRGFARHRASGTAGIEPVLLDLAEGLFLELAASQAQPVLLHGDLHHDNILRDAARGWLAIDPKGVVGEPAYEMGAMLRNPTEDPARFADSDIVGRRAALICERLGFDRRRVLGWAFAQAVLSAVWSIEDGFDPGRGLATAQAIEPLLHG